ncbi:Uncharacterised protein [Vibrio cholerae]|nr:Uncharacterised protein [Vibrio cholerae]
MLADQIDPPRSLHKVRSIIAKELCKGCSHVLD